MSTPFKNVLIVELNEFNVELLRCAVSQLSLPGLEKVLSFPRTQYQTQDTEQSGFLEPWVQWVSIHTGLPSFVHQIKHLGDVPDLGYAQCWEVLGNKNISTGMWGIMNGSHPHAKGVHFFLPDPWTFSEKAYPPELNNLLDLPRYISKNYQNLSKKILLTCTLKLFSFLRKTGILKHLLVESIKLFLHIIRFPKKAFVYISYFEYISTLLFIKYKKKTQPQCALLFLNSLAHLQHHHWRHPSTILTPEMKLGIKYLDKIFTQLFKQFPDDAFIIHNGLSQMNTNHEAPWVLYRQKDPVEFLNLLEKPPIRVEQNMTHDGHAFFKSPEDCQKAFHSLQHSEILGTPLFKAELTASNPTKLFYQLEYTALITDPFIEFMLEQKKYPFFKYFDKIVTRTGRHIPKGSIYSDAVIFPSNMKNHEFNKYLYRYFFPKIKDPLTKSPDVKERLSLELT